MKAFKFNDFLNEGFDALTPNVDNFGNFALKLLAARDQARVKESIFNHETKTKIFSRTCHCME